MTKDHKKALIIVAAVVGGSYAVKYAVTIAVSRPYNNHVAQLQVEAAAREKRAAAERAATIAAKKAEQEAKAAERKAAEEAERRRKEQAAAVSPSVLQVRFEDFIGIWKGRLVLDDRGTCELKFEIQAKRNQPGKAEGFSELRCIAAGGIGPRDPKKALIGRNPVIGAFTGALEDGALEFSVDRVLGYPCTPVSFRIAPQGTGELAAVWTERGCAGGYATLRRSRG